MYDAHVRQKNAARRQKDIMRKLELPVSPGSEGVITPKEDWISKHGYWTDEDEPSTSHHGEGED